MIAPHPLPAHGAFTAPDHRLRALAVCGALLTTGLLWLASRALGVTLMIDLHNGKPPQLFGPVFLLSFTLLFSLLGWGTLAILEHITRWALPLWTGLSVVVLVASLEPITSVGATGSAKAVLATIHFSVAAVLITVMRRSAARGRHADTGTCTVNTQGADTARLRGDGRLHGSIQQRPCCIRRTGGNTRFECSGARETPPRTRGRACCDGRSVRRDI